MKDWIKEFEVQWLSGDFQDIDTETDPNRIIDFIRSLLASERAEMEQNLDNEWDRFMIALWGWAFQYTKYWKKRPSASAPFYTENSIKRAIRNMVFTGQLNDKDTSFDAWVNLGREFMSKLLVKKAIGVSSKKLVNQTNVTPCGDNPLQKECKRGEHMARGVCHNCESAPQPKDFKKQVYEIVHGVFAEDINEDFFIDELTHLLARERRNIKEKVERLKLEVDVVVCDCGEPYKDSDLAGLLDELLEELE